PSSAYRCSIQKKIIARHGAVVSAHPLASQAGLTVLKQGGNAIDAAIATQLALAVVYPGAGNIGGGGFLVASFPGGKNIAIDFREKAPGAAFRDMYLDDAGNVQPGISINGHLAAGVPGSVAGMFAAAKYGRLPFSKLIQPAIDLAQGGFSLTEHEASSLNELRPELGRFNSIMPAFARKDGREWRAGDTLVQADLARTLTRIRDSGQKGFYEGETAGLIVDEMKRGKGIISLADLRAYEAKFREPHVFTYKGYTIVGMPMPSSGGVLIHQMMKMIEQRNIAGMGFESAASVQLMTEVERRAYADRAKYMGDIDFYSVPEKELVDSTYLAGRMKNYQPGVAGSSQSVPPGELPAHESKQTTHFYVVDGDGMSVAVTTTLNDSYGCKTVVGHAGFFLNDEMDDFSAKPGVPNLYGAIGGEANAIVPGKRMLSSMTPTIVLQNGKPWAVMGTPGGTTIPTSVFQTLVDLIEFRMTTEDAVDKPKFHHQWLPDTVLLEIGFPDSTSRSLRAMGYKIESDGSIGRTEVIRVLPDGSYEAVADRRGEDDAEGY
ncbi:MAG TPA: gamma-glutamyltransferase, partial [Chitinophagaceae bacterium]